MPFGIQTEQKDTLPCPVPHAFHVIGCHRAGTVKGKLFVGFCLCYSAAEFHDAFYLGGLHLSYTVDGKELLHA